MEQHYKMDCRNAAWPRDRERFINYLESLASEKYRDFSKSLIPGEFVMLGINIPTLKKIAKEIYRGDYEEFLKINDGNIFEVKFLKGQVIANIRDEALYEKWFRWYLPLITDWSLCDSFVAASKVIKKNREHFFEIACELVRSEAEFEKRVGFVILLNYFVDAEYANKIFALVDGYDGGEYYADMALAWLLSVLYVKFPDETYEFLAKGSVTSEVVRYTIRKVRDSYRVSDENKERIKKIV